MSRWGKFSFSAAEEVRVVEEEIRVVEGEILVADEEIQASRRGKRIGDMGGGVLNVLCFCISWPSQLLSVKDSIGPKRV